LNNAGTNTPPVENSLLGQQGVSDSLRIRAERVLEAFVGKFGGVGVNGAVIATVDGLDVAVATLPGEGGAKLSSMSSSLSAMSSSISAIGDLVATEIGAGSHHRSITIESDNGYMFIMSIRHPDSPMVLSVTASKEAMLGKLVYYAKQVVVKMIEP
jgi:predicted regulator of Ras-like GTPase activity (Roadblock/LC7/MglB family)